MIGLVPARLDGDFSIPPEQVLRALLLQAFYSIRPERQVMEQLDYNLLFRLRAQGIRPVATVTAKPADRNPATARFITPLLKHRYPNAVFQAERVLSRLLVFNLGHRWVGEGAYVRRNERSRHA